MEIKRISEVPGAPKPVGPYALRTEFNGIAYFSGQVALDENNRLVGGTVVEQTHQCMRNIATSLGHAGCTFSDVLTTDIFYVDPQAFSEINEVYGSYFNDGTYAARTTIGAAFLPLGAQVEIKVCAALPQPNADWRGEPCF